VGVEARSVPAAIEQRTRKEQVSGSSPLVGSSYPAMSIATAVYKILILKIGRTGAATFIVLRVL
jgi:hypothetical protein